MRMYDIILKKRNGQELTREEIKYVVNGYTNEKIPDYQVSALLMSIFFKGMTIKETVDLTESMMKSGDLMDLSKIEGIVVDKHSTGGVGDTTTLILAPLVASCDVPVAKMSGRGLGHTGGTIDKLESIKDFDTNLTVDKFIDNVNQIKIAIAGQTGILAPADKKLYALRDVTATVDQLSLIASSIMSKKLASGSDAILLDVKVGSGAFMKSTEEAFNLAEIMVKIGNDMGKNTKA
ncbi:MAG TPA: thymidine phosphorylase, partial [Eubacteriaceae bacterium]|nr:thymidine phosphorylase [Eubacteriaceae bacterium]